MDLFLKRTACSICWGFPAVADYRLPPKVRDFFPFRMQRALTFGGDCR